MVRYFYRHFRVVDCTRHCGLPVTVACFLLALITGAMQAYSLYFIYDPWNYIMMGYAGGTAAVGLIAVLTGFRVFTILYLLAETLCNIPVGVVIGFVSWAISEQDSPCWYRFSTYCSYTDYERWLLNFDDGFLWSGDIVAFISVIFSCLTLAGYRKLRLYQAGVGTAVQHGRRLEAADGCIGEAHHHHHTVVQQPIAVVAQPTIVTVPTSPPPVVVQTQPSLYPQIQTAPYGATIVQQNQPTLYI